MTQTDTTPRTQGWSPDWVTQAAAGYTYADVLDLPEDAPPRVELLDGVLIVLPTPAMAHQNIAFRLWRWLADHSPAEFEPTGAVGVLIDERNTLEPDVLLLRAPAKTSDHFFAPEQVVMAVEVVSPGTQTRDRIVKPALYGAAGIPHYWRVEQEPQPCVWAYTLNGGVYQLAGASAGHLELSAPFPLVLPVAALAG